MHLLVSFFAIGPTSSLSDSTLMRPTCRVFGVRSLELRRTPPAVFLVCTECMFETTFEPILAFPSVALFLADLTCKSLVGNQYRQNTSPHVRVCARPTILCEQNGRQLLAYLGRTKGSKF